VEEIERQLISEMESKMEEDRKFREDREQELLALEEERRKYERLVSETEVSIDDEVRRRRVLETRNAKVELQHKKVEEDNERLQMMLKEAEEARTTIEQAKADAEAKNAKIEEELLSIDEQSAKRQEYIEELKQKLESERLRLEQELRTQQDGRKTDATNFKQKEEDQMAVIAKASEDVRLVKEDQEEKRRKFETNITRLDQVFLEILCRCEAKRVFTCLPTGGQVFRSGAQSRGIAFGGTARAMFCAERAA
jgi:chromosome segregation ATPase